MYVETLERIAPKLGFEYYIGPLRESSLSVNRPVFSPKSPVPFFDAWTRPRVVEQPATALKLLLMIAHFADTWNSLLPRERLDLLECLASDFERIGPATELGPPPPLPQLLEMAQALEVGDDFPPLGFLESGDWVGQPKD